KALPHARWCSRIGRAARQQECTQAWASPRNAVVTWWAGIPSSSSHALISGLVGAALVKAGLSSIVCGPGPVITGAFKGAQAVEDQPMTSVASFDQENSGKRAFVMP